MLEKLAALHDAGELRFTEAHAGLAKRRAFLEYLKPLRRTRWFVYAKRPFAGRKAVLAYLSRYTHCVAISNRQLLSADAASVTFRVKHYRRDDPQSYTSMTLEPHEFIRHFLLHVLPKGYHRIRHCDLLASGVNARNLARMRELLDVAPPPIEPEPTVPAADTDDVLATPCPCCGARMLRIIEVFEAGSQLRHEGSPSRIAVRIETS